MTTIKEDYVSFETAKLLKEKGFDETCYACYEYFSSSITMYSGWPFSYKGEVVNNSKDRIKCPTLQMAMKWLRKEHKLHIQIWILEEKGYWFDIEKILNAQYKHKSLYSTGLEEIYFESYEQACEAAIKYCLENLI